MSPNDNPDIIGFLECEGRRITNKMWYYLPDRNDGIGHTGQGKALHVNTAAQHKNIIGGKRSTMESLWMRSTDVNSNSIAVPPTL